jgi:hypothetical protein
MSSASSPQAEATEVSVNGVVVAVLNRGEFHERVIVGNSHVTSNLPILVAQYSQGSWVDDNDIADPSRVLVQPVGAFRDHYLVTTPSNWFDDANFVQLVVPTGQVGNIRLDGVPIPAAQYTAIPTSPFSGARVPISKGSTHRLTGPAVPFGAFVYGERLVPLPGTGREAAVIARVFERASGTADVLTRDLATIGNLRRRAPGKRYLHLATHGLVGTREKPYHSSLALTRPPKYTRDDLGFLTLDELVGRWRGKLRGCELVVLSACQTNVGTRVGDSSMALPWGFLYAGAPRVVGSLWKVSDGVTALLMERFYENLLGVHVEPRVFAARQFSKGQRMPTVLALREAQRWLLSLTVERLVTYLASRHGDKADAARELKTLLGEARGFSSSEKVEAPEASRLAKDATERPFERPYYWAAFVLVGDPAGEE